MAELTRTKPLLGTFVEITAMGEDARATAAVSKAFDAVQAIHDSLSFQSPDSDLTKLNLAGGAWVTVPHHARRVIRLARAMTRASGGLFNATVGGRMVRLGVLPDHGFTGMAPSGTADDIEIKGDQVRLKGGILLTLDGIAKGYAVDRAVAVLKQHGAEGGIVNAGGDLRVFGTAQAPIILRQSDGSFTPVGMLADGAVASSGGQEADDERFPGRIVGQGSASGEAVSVMAAQAWRADALTKVASLSAGDDARDLVGRLGGQLIGGA